MTIQAKKHLGQHFLEKQWVDKLIDEINPSQDETFFEIGAGSGALTVNLANRVEKIVAVEIDRNLASDLKNRVPTNVTIIIEDFLALNLEKLFELKTVARVVGNLPYNASIPILKKLIRCSLNGNRFKDANLMLQHEVAERITAKPGSSNWGPLAVTTQLYADVKQTLQIPSGAFRPMPRVRSTLLCLRFREPTQTLTNPNLFEQMVRALFTQRRKTALNALRPLTLKMKSAPAEEIFNRASLNSKLRPEQLSLSELAELSEVLGASSL